MDNKDGRRSRVPAGTFGQSGAPPAPARTPPPPPPRPHAKTLTGEDDAPVPPPPPSSARSEEAAEADRAELDGAEAGEARKRHVSTLVGVPAIAARSAAPPSSAPILAPPPWRGAQPYLEGQEPQLRISSIPAPTHVPSAPSASGEPTRNRVTTKMAPVPPAPMHQPTEGSPGAGAVSPPLGDTIQEMLDAQASVPMQVDEQADRGAAPALRSGAPLARTSEETPIDEVPIDEILESLSEPPPPIESAEPARTRNDEPTLVHAAPPPADGPRISEPEAESESESVSEPVSEPESDAAPESVPEPVAARPAPQPPPPPPRERPRRAVSAPVANPAADPVTSLAPAEVSRRPPRYRDDAQAGLGIVLVAAMGVIGVGGWFLTRGGYPGAHQQQTQASAAALPPATTPPALPPAQPPIAPAQATAPIAAPATEQLSTANAASKTTMKKAATAPRPILPRPGAKSDDSEDVAAAEAAPSEDTVLKVTPHRDAPGEMSDIPSRDDVLAALAPIRAAVTECARGQRGVAQLDITVANTGFVTHAVVGGDFAGTPEGSCIARVARSAQFVPFKKPRFRVIYPFSL